jgi:hypothetical protein
MMSPNMLAGADDLDSKLEQFMDFAEGDITSYQYDDAGDEWIKQEGQYRVRNVAHLNFSTSRGEIKVVFYYEIVNTRSPENKGICEISVGDNNTKERLLLIQSKTDEFFKEN